MHENFKRDEVVKGSSNRSFGLIFTVFFGFLASAKLYAGLYVWAAFWGVLAVIVLLLALLAPKALAPFNRLWTQVGLLLHKITNPVIMGAMFFCVITPFGVAMRLFGWDALARKLDPGASTYWIERVPPGPARETMTQQF